MIGYLRTATSPSQIETRRDHPLGPSGSCCPCPNLAVGRGNDMGRYEGSGWIILLKKWESLSGSIKLDHVRSRKIFMYELRIQKKCIKGVTVLPMCKGTPSNSPSVFACLLLQVLSPRNVGKLCMQIPFSVVKNRVPRVKVPFNRPRKKIRSESFMLHSPMFNC